MLVTHDEMDALHQRMLDLAKAVKRKGNPDYVLDPVTHRYKLKEPKKKGGKKEATTLAPPAPAHTPEDVVRGMGGKLWEGGGKRRYYFGNVHALAGFVAERYGSGNIASATLDGERLSNNKALQYDMALRSAKAWWDPEDGQFHVSDLGPNFTARITRKLQAQFVAAGGVAPATPAPTPAPAATEPKPAPVAPAPAVPGPKFQIERDGRRVYILGDTDFHAEKLRGIGAKYDRDRRAWYTLDEGGATALVAQLNGG